MKIHYACQRCTNCCRWPGWVRISDREISAISRFLGCSEYEFIQRFTRLRPQRDGLALEENTDGSCVFLEGKNCRINAVKPDQCAGFPNTWNFPGWRDICEAVPVVEEDWELVPEGVVGLCREEAIHNSPGACRI